MIQIPVLVLFDNGRYYQLKDEIRGDGWIIEFGPDHPPELFLLKISGESLQDTHRRASELITSLGITGSVPHHWGSNDRYFSPLRLERAAWFNLTITSPLPASLVPQGHRPVTRRPKQAVYETFGGTAREFART